MFTQKCFIRKNTPELVNKLSITCCLQYPLLFNSEYNVLYASPKFVRCVTNGFIEILLADGFIDCGTNEELFLAIAALRDDTDKNQWFIHDDSDWNDTPNIFWYKCESEFINIDLAYNLMCNDCKKARVQELIEHFNE